MSDRPSPRLTLAERQRLATAEAGVDPYNLCGPYAVEEVRLLHWRVVGPDGKTVRDTIAYGYEAQRYANELTAAWFAGQAAMDDPATPALWRRKKEV